MRKLGFASLAVCALSLGPPAAFALDSASLQFTVPAPDPVQAGETLALQALAVNTGGAQWLAGSYYWLGEIYDLDYHLIARTEQISPRDAVAAGAVASISLPFHVPETMYGRRLYRVFLIKDNQTLIQSEYKGFQIIERPIPPAPEVVSYHVEGNVTVALKNSSSNKWRKPSGATTLNSVGKIKDSSYLLNIYLLHEPGRAVDPYIVVGNYYAPWGTIYAGDISPTLGPLSVNGQGMRGAMLEQKKGRFNWALLGGQTVTSQPGTALTNGRYARTLYAGKAGVEFLSGVVKANINYFTSNDETGSLSSDPKSNNFRGPSLAAAKNSGTGLDLSWEPVPRLKFLIAYQKNAFSPDTSKPLANDKAYKLEFGWERKVFKLRAYLQQAGANFVAFGAPSVVGDRQTMDVSLGLYPAPWYTFTLAANQYHDNLKNNPAKVTTTQRVVNMGHALQFQTRTTVSLNASLNTAKGKPSTVLDNQTMTVGLGVGQGIKSHNVSLNVQSSQFRDKNRLAHDLDTQIVGFSSNWRLPRKWGLSLGLTTTQTKDKRDGSKRSSNSFGPGMTVPINAKWTSQYWGTYTATKNTSPVFPSDTTTLTFNTEYTWSRTPQNNITFGIGANQNKDKIAPSNNVKELTASFRYSYSF